MDSGFVCTAAGAQRQLSSFSPKVSRRGARAQKLELKSCWAHEGGLSLRMLVHKLADLLFFFYEGWGGTYSPALHAVLVSATR
jgi:hypothetical protein